MTEQEEQLSALTEMRDLMNKSSRFISMSGWSGVSAGVCGLLGVYLAYELLGPFFLDLPIYATAIIDSLNETVLERVIGGMGLAILLQSLIKIAISILGLALFSAWFFTWRKSKKLNMSMWDDTAKRMVFNLLLPLVPGGLFALLLTWHGVIGLVPGCTLVFYGLALINASKYTLNDIRTLGIIEMVLGMLALIFYKYSIVLWGVGFGIMHIIYGIVLYVKYDKKKA